MSEIPASASVVVVGAGPTGLTAAVMLADADIDVVVLDGLAEGANTSRAVALHARTLEVLRELGIADELRDRGLEVPRFTLRDGGHRLGTISFAGLDTDYPYVLSLGQQITESVLLTRLRKAGGDVHRPYRVTAVRGDDTGVTVEYADAAGGSGAIRADYAIGADGMHSVVRDQAGIGFTGDTYPESFVLADVRMDWPDSRDQLTLQLSRAGITVIAPLPDETPDRFRVVATVDRAPELPTLADIQAILDARRPGARIRELLWSSRFRVHHRVAETYRAGRILLAGDAAHVHSPAGGQGMNTGIQDAALLGTLLARVLRGESPDLLDTYEARRRPIALGVVALTDRMTTMATLRSRPARAVRNTAIRLLTRIPAVRQRIAYQLSELAN